MNEGTSSNTAGNRQQHTHTATAPAQAATTHIQRWCAVRSTSHYYYFTVAVLIEFTRTCAAAPKVSGLCECNRLLLQQFVRV